MVKFTVLFSKTARKDAKKLSSAKLEATAKSLIEILKKNPYQNPPPFEKLIGNLAGAYSRRINIRHRLVYQVWEETRIVRILRMWTHYE